MGFFSILLRQKQFYLALSQCNKIMMTKKVKAEYSSSQESISELRGVTCHMGSHCITCHPTQVNAPSLNPS